MKEKGLSHIILLLAVGVVVLLSLSTLSTTQQPKVTSRINPKANLATTNKESTSSALLQRDNLEKYLKVETALLGVLDNVSLYFKDLSTQNPDISIEPSRSWLPASTIKAYVILEAFRQRRVGLINFDQPIAITAENVVPTELETDEFPRLREGTQVTIGQLVEAMIIQSDNTAYNTLLDVLDRRNIQLALRNIGLTETVIGEKVNLDTSQLALDLEVPGRQSNTTTVKDFASFFDLLYSKKIPDSEEILAIFKRQKINNMIPALLPDNVAIAHKTGDWAPIYHDGGVVYKPSSPFILTVFTNTGDPSVVAKIARVAYFQNVAVVGQDVTPNSTNRPTSQNSHRPPIFLAASSYEQVLAESTEDKFPTVTAADLGINPIDLSINPAVTKKFNQAVIIPGSFLYDIKRFIEDRQSKAAKGNKQKVESYLNQSKNRLAEVKTLLSQNQVDEADQLLKQSEEAIEQATNLAKNDPDNKDLLLVETKQLSDLQFATLADRGKNLPDQEKQKFIDSVYNFYQNHQQKVAPVVNISVIANPLQQKPAVGTITNVHDNQATLKFDDGSSKDLVIPQDTRVRSFQSEDYQNPDSLAEGDKVAVIGLTNSTSKIIPQFILKDVPPELSDKHQGTVIEITPDQNTLKILDKKGQAVLVKVDQNTDIKSKDTNVTLEGIKAGSQVTVFGVTENNMPLLSLPFGLEKLPVMNKFFASQIKQLVNQISSQTGNLASPSPASSLGPAGSPAKNTPAPSSSAKPPTSDLPVPQPAGTVSPVGGPNVGGKTNVKVPSGSVPPSSKPSLKQAPVPVLPHNIVPTLQLKATSVTVTGNSSGKHEESQKAKSSPPQKALPPPLLKSNKATEDSDKKH